MRLYKTLSPDINNARKLDRFAIFLSGLCLLHCLAAPFALLLGPVLGHWLTDTETGVHWALLGIAAPISLLALGRGYGRHHKVSTLVLGVFGLLLMFIGVLHWFGEETEIAFTVAGVLLLIAAHIRNLVADSAIHQH